jgi:four helix bundle protein
MKRKDSEKFRIWKEEMDYLAENYEIKLKHSENYQLELLNHIRKAADTIPAEIERALGRKAGKSVKKFLKTTADTILELQNILSIALNVEMISISEYHSLSKKLSEIAELIKALNKNINLHPEEPELQAPENMNYWILN